MGRPYTLSLWPRPVDPKRYINLMPVYNGIYISREAQK